VRDGEHAIGLSNPRVCEQGGDGCARVVRNREHRCWIGFGGRSTQWRREREVAACGVLGPDPRDAIGVRPAPRCVGEADSLLRAAPPDEEAGPGRPLRRDDRVELQLAQRLHRAPHSCRAAIGAALVVHEDRIDRGMTGEDVAAERGGDDRQLQFGADPLDLAEERGREDDVAEERRLDDGDPAQRCDSRRARSRPTAAARSGMLISWWPVRPKLTPLPSVGRLRTFSSVR